MFRRTERRKIDKSDEEDTSKYLKLVFITSFIITLIISAVIVFKSEKDNQTIRSVLVLRMADGYVREIENVINSNVALSYSLNMLIHEGEEGQVDDFDEIGRHILTLYPDISSIILAPGGVVQHIYPREGNDGAIGHDVFRDNDMTTESILTKKSGVLTVSGPYELDQGGYSIMGWFPVTLKDEYGNKKFWGFTGVSMHIDDILLSAQIDELVERGYNYEIWRIDPDTQTKQIISCSELPVVDPEELEIALPNNKWYLGVSPTKGWVNIKNIYIKSIISILTSNFIGLFFWILAKLKISKEELERIAFYDRLTGLPNRRFFFQEVDRMILKSKVENKLLAIGYMDLDNFKFINDNYGHAVGDKLLQIVTNRCTDVISKTDIMARFGGDEFVFLIYGYDNKEDIGKVLDKIIYEVSRPVRLEESTILPSISIGVIVSPCEKGSPDALLNKADSALYRAKAAGKNQYVFYS